jgi:hypothetical protein
MRITYYIFSELFRLPDVLMIDEELHRFYDRPDIDYHYMPIKITFDYDFEWSRFNYEDFL